MGEPTRDGAPWGVRLHSILDDAARRRPDAPAVRDERGGWSYAELADHSRRFAHWLRERGVRPGDRVLLRTANRREQVAMVFGAARAGAIAVPVHRDLKPFLLADLVADADPAVVVLEDGDTDGWASVGGRAAVGVTELWTRLDGTGTVADAPEADTIPADLCLMIYTSGSTSRPKAVTSSHAQVHFATLAIAERLGYRADDVVFVRLPLSFDYGLYQVFLAALSTASVVFSDSGPDLTLDRQIRAAGATVVPLVPSIAATLTALAERVRPGAPQPAPSPVRLFTNTGAAMSAQTIDRLRRAYPDARICLMFGITECKRVTIGEPDGDLTRPNSVGRPLPGTQVQILTEAGTPAPAGEVGEIVVRGPHVMTGYWRAPELTAARFRADPRTGERRLHTGDYGYLDADGHLYFTGRRDDIVKRRGLRVSLIEIESAVSRVPGVSQCAAVHDADGDRLDVYVTGTVTADDVLRQLGQWLDPARRPDSCHLVDRLPVTGNGKIDRAALRRRTEELPA
ncbi:class I adenylate-forming enzyme family protein [Polymorphospora sp. NPDC051019]|uniref:class I adenylate-forming enzyme family protein n=1 Tax=Polymorphospora sp. NPDC051019 TaxID=3155725 RepID=UPI00343BB19A